MESPASVSLPTLNANLEKLRRELENLYATAKSGNLDPVNTKDNPALASAMVIRGR